MKKEIEISEQKKAFHKWWHNIFYTYQATFTRIPRYLLSRDICQR